jgi:hypothetical protein
VRVYAVRSYVDMIEIEMPVTMGHAALAPQKSEPVEGARRYVATAQLARQGQPGNQTARRSNTTPGFFRWSGQFSVARSTFTRLGRYGV